MGGYGRFLTRNFNFSDGESHDATVSETTEPLKSESNYTFNVTPNLNLAGGVGTYTVQVSNDLVNWFNYAEEFTNVSTENGIEDVQLTFSYMRIVFNAGSITGGTIGFLLAQKYHS